MPKDGTRVGIALAPPTRGGFSAVFAEIDDLLAMGVDVELITTSGGDISSLQGRVPVEVVDVDHRDALRFGIAVHRWVRSHAIDLLHVHGRAAGVGARAGAIGTDAFVVYTPHGGFPPKGRVAKMLERLVQRFLRQATDCFAMVGATELEAWEREYGFGTRSRLELSQQIPESDEGDEFDPGTDLLVLVPGAYHERKRFLDVVEAASSSLPPSAGLVLVGSTPKYSRRYRDECEAALTSLGHPSRCVVLDEQPTLRPLLAADLVLLPSELEGMSLVALECAALRVPVAWSDIPCHREVFGVSGISFVAGDTGAIANVLREPARWPEFRAALSADVADRARTRRTTLATMLSLAGGSSRTPPDGAQTVSDEGDGVDSAG